MIGMIIIINKDYMIIIIYKDFKINIINKDYMIIRFQVMKMNYIGINNINNYNQH